MESIPLTFASGLYDRMVPLARGQVRCPGIALNFIDIPHPREIFDRMMGTGEFDASELSSSEYISNYAAGDRSLVALPVFPSRAFRHSCIYVNTKTIRQPSDLSGKRVGIPLYTMTAAVWIRGLLQHEYGVDIDSIAWIEGDVEKPGIYGSPSAMPPVKKLNIERNTSSKSLSQMLEDGELDAIVSPDRPSSMARSAHLQRLFPDFKQVEIAYFKKTGLFPIMHVVVIQRDYYERYRFAATSLFRALCQSKDIARKGLMYTGTLRYMVPWLLADVEEMEDVFKGDCWPYGLEPNRKTLETLVQYLAEQGMIQQVLKVDDLFVPLKNEL